MLDKLLNTLAKLANGWAILPLVGAFVLLDNVIASPAEARIRSLAGGPIEQLDLNPSYTPEAAYSIISAYGNQGRRLYALKTLTIDTIRPLIFALLFSLLITLQPVEKGSKMKRFLGKNVLKKGYFGADG